MVCEKCESKLKSVATADPFHRSRSIGDKAGSSSSSSGRKINENKALSNGRYDPVKGYRKCRICQSKIFQEGSYYCQNCSYKKGICGMCGKKILSIKSYRQSAT